MSSLQVVMDNTLRTQVQTLNQVRRKGRYPVHNYLVHHRPWQIKPFMLAPVFPGDTMKTLAHQSRTVSDPLERGAGNITPWWCEHYYFYVKVRQLGEDVATAFTDMVLNGTPMGINDPANTYTNHSGVGINWLQRALYFITEEGGFRNEGEPWNAGTIDGVPAAAAIMHKRNWADSLMPAANVDPEDDPIPDNNNLQNPHAVVMPDLMAAYERMREMRLIDLSFEDYLAIHGVNTPQQDTLEKPELIRVESSWMYPSNNYDPVESGYVGSLNFSKEFRADKDRFFKEPGFIVGVTVCRPKLFMGNQRNPVANQLLDNAFAWSPRLMADQPHISIRGFIGGANGNGPLDNQTLGYWVDARDAFLYGDQFFDAAVAGQYAPALPAANGEKRYATAEMANAFFAKDGQHHFRMDGTTRLTVLSHPSNATDAT